MPKCDIGVLTRNKWRGYWQKLPLKIKRRIWGRALDYTVDEVRGQKIPYNELIKKISDRAKELFPRSQGFEGMIQKEINEIIRAAQKMK